MAEAQTATAWEAPAPAEAERDVVAELDSISQHVAEKYGKGDEQPYAPNALTPLRRLENHLASARFSLEQVVGGATLHKRWKGYGADSEIVTHEQEPGD